MHTSDSLAVVGLVLVGLLMAGCATAPTRLESTYGASYHFVRAAQTLHPEGVTPRASGQEFDGKAAKHTLERYRSTFEKPSQPPSFIISVGGIK